MLSAVELTPSDVIHYATKNLPLLYTHGTDDTNTIPKWYITASTLLVTRLLLRLDLVHPRVGVVHKTINPYGTSHTSWWILAIWPFLLCSLGRQTSNCLQLAYPTMLLFWSLSQSDAPSKCFPLWILMMKSNTNLPIQTIRLQASDSLLIHAHSDILLNLRLDNHCSTIVAATLPDKPTNTSSVWYLIPWKHAYRTLVYCT